jgi:hypothetical protein
LLPSLLEISLLAIVIELVTNCSILARDPNLGVFTIMHNGPNVCEEKDEKGRINNSFDTKAFNLNEIFYNFNQVN